MSGATAPLLHGMMQAHALDRDVCLVGGRGVGKSGLARVFGETLGLPQSSLSRLATCPPPDPAGLFSKGGDVIKLQGSITIPMAGINRVYL